MSATNRGSEREDNDGYYTPIDCAQAICARLQRDGLVLPKPSVLEPSIGKGAFAAAADQVFATSTLVGVDLVRHALAIDALGKFVEGDFLAYEPEEYFELVIGNPPYKHAEPHILHALKMLDPDDGCLAFLLRMNFVEGVERCATGIWSDASTRPQMIYVLNRRPSFKKTKKPKLDKEGQPVLNKKTGKPLMVSSSNDACAYGVFVWKRGHVGNRYPEPVMRWLEW